MSGHPDSSAREDDQSRYDSLQSLVWRSVVPGLVATLLIGVGALGVGWLPLNTSLVDWAVVDAMRGTTMGAAVSKFAVILGAMLLLQAWLLLGYDILRGRVTRMWHLWVVMGAWSLPLMITPPLFSRDVYSYFTQGKLLLDGLNPYTDGSSSVPGWFGFGVDPMWGEAATPYGQLWLVLARGVVSFVGPHPYAGALLLRLLAVVGVVLLLWGVARLAQACGIEAPKAVWLGVLNPLVLMHFVSGAHNDALMAGLVVAGLALAVDRHPVLGVILVTLGGSIKPIGLLALPFVAFFWAGTRTNYWRVIRYWVYASIIAGVILIGFAFLTGTGFGWLAALSTPGAVRTWLSPPTAIGMILGWLASLAGWELTDFFVSACRLIGTIASVATVAYLALKPWGRTPVRAAALAFLAVVVFGPVVQPWYVLWSLPLLAAAGLRRMELRAVLIVTVILSLYGVVSSSATQDSLFQLSDFLAVAVVTAATLLVLAVSPRERQLLLGEGPDFRLLPSTPEQLVQAESMTMRRV